MGIKLTQIGKQAAEDKAYWIMDMKAPENMIRQWIGTRRGAYPMKSALMIERTLAVAWDKPESVDWVQEPTWISEETLACVPALIDPKTVRTCFLGCVNDWMAFAVGKGVRWAHRKSVEALRDAIFFVVEYDVQTAGELLACYSKDGEIEGVLALMTGEPLEKIAQEIARRAKV